MRKTLELQHAKKEDELGSFSTSQPGGHSTGQSFFRVHLQFSHHQHAADFGEGASDARLCGFSFFFFVLYVDIFSLVPVCWLSFPSLAEINPVPL